MLPSEYIKRATNREHVLLLRWLHYQEQSSKNEPSRTDHYLMQVALEVKRIYNALTQQRQSMSLAQFKIPFGKATQDDISEDSDVEVTMEERRAMTRQALAVWNVRTNSGKKNHERDRT